jgi:hypothetical protein
MHCMAYSCGEMSVGTETFGRTSYFRRGIDRDWIVAIGAEGVETSLELSGSIGVVALLDTVDGSDDKSD